MIDQLNSIGSRALEQIKGVQSVSALEEIRVSILGKKGALSEVLRGLGAVSATDRPKIGAVANEWKVKIETALEARRSDLEAAELEKKMGSEKVDTTLPARMPHRGSLHLITQVTRQMVSVFERMGFDVASGPEAETEYLCFESVNFPPDHPARDMQDTFFLGPGVVLRTHTTPVQMRALLSRDLPVRVLAPGAVYRCDSDATHIPMFHQIEGLWVDQGVRMSDLRGTLDFFAKEMFGAGSKIRLRPSYFPFVEPGCEVDVSCPFCKKGQSCRVCKDTGWIEILGAGMVHPNLYRSAGIEERNVSGFAFGVGVERVAMLLHGVPDLRLMNQGDVRFLSQF